MPPGGYERGGSLDYYKRMMAGIAPFLTERKLLAVNVCIVWLLFLVATYAAFSAYLPSRRGPVFMELIKANFGSEVTTGTWETVKNCAKA